jgi:selenocysteine lyase/cysteine desulfurase
MHVPDLRAETPACAAGNHLNNASAALLPEPVIHAMRGYLDDELALGPQGAAERHVERLDAAIASTARLLGTTRVECFDTVSRTFALLLGALEWREGDRILLARSEWGAVIAAVEALARNAGVRVEWIPVMENGEIDDDALAGRMDDRVRVLSLPLLPAIGGRPVLRAHFDRPDGCLVFADGAQALGQTGFEMSGSGFDVVVGTARKWLRGPRGIAFAGLSPRGERLMEGARWLGSTPDRTTVVSDHTRLLRIGLGAAADYALAIGLERIEERVAALARALHDGLSAVRGVVPVFPAPRTGIVAFSATGQEDRVVAALARQRIRVALVTARYHPVLFEDRGLDRVVRVSPHYYNTEAEIAACVEAVARALSG